MEANENENTMIEKSLGCSKRGSKRETYSNTGLLQKARKISNNLTLHLKEPEGKKRKKKKRE